MGVIAIQGVAVGHHPGRRIVAGHGEGIAQRRDHRLHAGVGHPATDHIDPADAQALQAVRRTDGETATLGQCRRVRTAAGGKVFLEDRDQPAIGAYPTDVHPVIEVGDVQHQVGGAGIAIRIGQGVGEGLGPFAAAMKIDEVRIRRIQGVGVGAVRSQDQGPVGPDEGPGNDRVGHAVGALDIVGQHIAGQHRRYFGCHRRVAVVHCPRHVVEDGDIQTAAGDITIAVAGRHRDAFAQGAAGGGEGVAVADHTAGRIIAGDGQDISEAGAEGLPYTGNRTIGQDIDAADIQVEHPVRGHHAEGAGLGQRAGVAGRTQRQVGFVDGEFAAFHRQSEKRDRVIDRRDRLVVVDKSDILVRQFKGKG